MASGLYQTIAQRTFREKCYPRSPSRLHSSTEIQRISGENSPTHVHMRTSSGYRSNMLRVSTSNMNMTSATANKHDWTPSDEPSPKDLNLLNQRATQFTDTKDTNLAIG